MILKKGDEIRIIAPSKSMAVLTEEQISGAKEKLESMGFVVTYGKHVLQQDNFYGCASIKSRIEDLHDAFKDKKVKCILAARGGYNVNQLLGYIDYSLIKNNPKIICGFSDITALTNAIYTKTNMITYSGPNYSNFAMKKGFEYTEEYFKKMFMKNENVEIISSDKYSDDAWYKDQYNRKFIENEGMKVINEGVATGTIIGGNLCTLNLLQGTEYMPDLNNAILFLEEDDNSLGENYLLEFDRNLESLIQIEEFSNVKAIIFGRSQIKSQMSEEKWTFMLKSKEKLKNIPIIVNADFGHTNPMFTFPIGGKCFISADNNNIKIVISDEII